MIMGNERGVSLIIVIFIIMLLGGLGWTLAVMLTGDFDMNLRMFNSEKALYAAQSGMHWALGQINANASWRTDSDNDSCSDATDWLLHSMDGAQYRVCCREANATESKDGEVAVIAEGYAPAYSGYQGSRRLNIVLSTGQFSRAAQARGLFDWSRIDKANSFVSGDIQALYYKGDNDTVHNEVGADYRSGASPLPTAGWGSAERVVAADPFPIIDMPQYENEASHVWQAPLTAKIKAIKTVDSGTRSELELYSAIFSGSGWNNQVVRNISRGHCVEGTWALIESVVTSPKVMVTLQGVVDWQPEERICIAARPLLQTNNPQGVRLTSSTNSYTITFPVAMFPGAASQYEGQVLRRLVYKHGANPPADGSWDSCDWGVITDVVSATQAVVTMDDDYSASADSLLRWDTVNANSGNQCWFSVVRRFRGDVKNEGLWYVCNDVLLDVRNKQDWEKKADTTVYFNKSGLVCEGDAVAKGPNELRFSKKPLVYPNLATKNGDIICTDTPSGVFWWIMINKRNFDDFAYSENGDVSFNYLDAKGVYGKNVFLDGVVWIDFDSSAVRKIGGYSFSLGGFKWKEE